MCGVDAQSLKLSYAKTALACLAAGLGHEECLRIFQGRGIVFDGFISHSAAKADNLSCLRIAYELGDQWDATSIKEAAFRGAS
jgi:hypothetical protein